MDNPNGKVSLLNYFIKGYSLLIKNPDIYLIGLLFNVVPIIIPLFTKILPSPLNFLSVILSLFVSLFSISYSFSIPLFFYDKQKHNQLSNSYLLRITMRNAKRLLIPLIVSFLTLTILIILTFILLAVSHTPKRGYYGFSE